MQGQYGRDPLHRGAAAFSAPMLLFASALVTGVIMWLSDWTVQQVDCSAFSSFLDRRHQHAHVQQMLAEAAALPSAQAAAAAAATGLQPAAARALGGVAADAMRRVGWRSGVKFARFDGGASLDDVLSDSLRFVGAFLLVLPGNGTLARRAKPTPFFAVDPAAAGLASALAPAAAALNAAAGALEAALGRRLFAFRLESAPLPACAAGGGPCAVWEASGGRLVLDAGLASKVAATAGGGTAGGAAEGAAAGAVAGHASGKRQLGATDSKDDASDAAAGGKQGTAAAAAAAAAAEPEEAAGGGGEEAGGTDDEGGSGLSALLAVFVDKLVEQAADAGALMKKGRATVSSLAAVFAKAGAAAVTLLLASHVPLWWCIACPLVLGMLSPFIFNFGLTAAAEALCAQLQLSDDTCTDLWWGAFAVAMMLSLASAVPIVYLCRLPECGRRGAAAGASALVAAAQMVAS